MVVNSWLFNVPAWLSRTTFPRISFPRCVSSYRAFCTVRQQLCCYCFWCVEQRCSWWLSRLFPHGRQLGTCFTCPDLPSASTSPKSGLCLALQQRASASPAGRLRHQNWRSFDVVRLALLKKKKMPWFAGFANSHGVNTLLAADFTLPLWCHWMWLSGANMHRPQHTAADGSQSVFVS